MRKKNTYQITTEQMGPLLKTHTGTLKMGHTCNSAKYVVVVFLIQLVKYLTLFSVFPQVL